MSTPMRTTDTWYKRAGIAAAVIAGLALVGSIFGAIGFSLMNGWLDSRIAPIKADIAVSAARLDGHDTRLNAQLALMTDERKRLDEVAGDVSKKLDGLHNDIADVMSLSKSTRDLLDHYFPSPSHPASASAFTEPVTAVQN